MAGNSIVIGSKFKPFSYAEMILPVMQATSALQELETQYGDLATKSSVWDLMANEQSDPYAYKLYKTYSDDLALLADVLAKQGLTPSSRRSMLEMKRRYSTDIVPIELAYTRRKELADEQRKLRALDNTLLFDRDAGTISLDELIKNPNIAPQQYSGALLSKLVGLAAQGLSKDMRDNPRKWRNILGNQYFESIMQKGYKPDEILQVLLNNPNASPVLQGIVEDAVNSSGVKGWADKNTLNRAYDYARQGLWNAVGETQYQVQTNKAYDYAMQERLANIKKKQEKLEGAPLYYRAVPKTTVNADKKTTQLADDAKFIQEIVSNPNLLSETKKRKVVSNTGDELFGTRGHLQQRKDSEETYQPNTERLKEITSRYGTKNPQELLQKIQNEIQTSAVREFSYKPNITKSDLISKVLKENVRTINRRGGQTGLYEIDSNGRKGDAVDIDDINKVFTDDLDLEFDPNIGFVINSTDSKGKTGAVTIDPEVLDDENRTFSKAMNAINVALDNGEDALANQLIQATMQAFYMKFNTLEKRLSDTDSKL